MKVMIVGGGAREHAIASCIVDAGGELYAYMGNRNPGILRMSSDAGLGKETEIEKVRDYAVSKRIEMAFIGPEAPLNAGLVDILKEAGIAAVGPTGAAARLETSKEFMRNLMSKYDLPGAIRYGVFSDAAEAASFIEELGQVAIKPVGLTGGKGVRVSGDHFASTEEAAAYAREVIENSIGGSARVVVEELLVGEEFTLQAFCDGKTVAAMPCVQDHKRAYEGDKGPNTGGMGSYSQADGLLPFMRGEEVEEAMMIMQRTLDAMREEGCPYSGVLYGQFMLTAKGPRVIEYNVRFGDPEAMNVLPLLRTDILEIGGAIADGTLKNDLAFDRKATVCKYIVPRGYGVKSVSGALINVEGWTDGPDRRLFYAAVNEEDGRIFTTTSRSMAVVGMGDTIEEAEAVAEDCLVCISSNDIFVRHDIGKPESIQRKIEHMEKVRGGE